MKFMTNIDLNKNQLLNAVLQQLPSAPASPKAGQAYYNTGDNRAYVFNGTKWVDITVAVNGTLDNPLFTGLPKVKTSVTKALGSASNQAFRIESSDSQPLFQVMTNGDTIIGGILKVNGTGESTFAGDVSIGGNLNVSGSVTGGTQVDLAQDMVIDGKLVVKGDTDLGDNAAEDKTTIKGLTTIYSKTTKALGNKTDNAFRILDSAGGDLFNVKTNGDAVIGGVLTVNGTGDSTFAGNVNIGGSLNVNGTITGGTKVDLGENLDIVGNLVVKGNTSLGDNALEDKVDIKALTSIFSPTTKAGGSAATNVFAVKDSGGVDIFAVKQNGDTVIGGVLKVDGSGTSTFTGDVSIGGKLTVAKDATVTADMTGNNFTVNGNLLVKSNTTLGDAAGDLISVVGKASFNQSIDMKNNLISNVLDPVGAKDVATKGYVDSVAQGLDVKQSVRAATTGNITLSAPQTVDGVVLVAGDRVLVKNQTDAKTNGIYLVQAGAWKRTDDADTGAKLNPGTFTFVEEGTTNEDAGWVLSTNGAVTIGTTAITFTQFSGANSFAAGNGLNRVGNEFNVVGTANRITVNPGNVDIASNYVGQTSITTLGTVGTGTWNATTIAVAKGGTGATSAKQALSNLGGAGKYAVSIGNGTLTEFTVTHSLGTDDVVVSVKEIATGNHVIADTQTIDANNIKVYFGSAPTSNQFKVVVVG